MYILYIYISCGDIEISIFCIYGKEDYINFLMKNMITGGYLHVNTLQL